MLNPLLGGPFVSLSETQTQLGKWVQSELALRKRAICLAKQCVPCGKLHIERSTRLGRKSKKWFSDPRRLWPGWVWGDRLIPFIPHMFAQWPQKACLLGVRAPGYGTSMVLCGLSGFHCTNPLSSIPSIECLHPHQLFAMPSTCWMFPFTSLSLAPMWC